MADVLNKLNRLPEATKTVQDAMHAFAGTPEEVRVLIANSELALRQGDVDAAVGMLGTVQPGSSAFAKAQQVRAHIYLHHRGDKRKYVRCFEELLESNPAPHNYVLLSDALMRVQRPDEAIEVGWLLRASTAPRSRCRRSRRWKRPWLYRLTTPP